MDSGVEPWPSLSGRVSGMFLGCLEGDISESRVGLGWVYDEGVMINRYYHHLVVML